MKYWKDFVDTLDTSGGHILILLSLFIMFHFRHDDYVREIGAALFLALKGIGKANGREMAKTRSTDIEVKKETVNVQTTN